jgi:hypothetical protein
MFEYLVVDLAHHGLFVSIIVLNVIDAFLCLYFCISVARPIIRMVAKPIAKQEVANVLWARRAENVQIHPECLMPQHSVPILSLLSNRQYVADRGQSRNIIFFSIRIGDNQINVDHWFCRQPWHCGRANMFNVQSNSGKYLGNQRFAGAIHFRPL